MVDDNDLIVFQSDANLSYPPTPALFQFSDTKGYKSNCAVVMFDPDGADSIAKVPPALGQLTDAAFWKSYAAEMTSANTDPPPEQFIAVTQAFAIATRMLGDVGPDPFAQADVDANYASWGGGKWADLLSTCAQMTSTAVSSTAPHYAARYWQLNLMVRMALKAYPPS